MMATAALQEDLLRFKRRLSEAPGSPETAELAARLAHALESAGQGRQAAKILEAVLGARPEDERLRVLTGKALERCGDAERALEVLTARPILDPQARLDTAGLLINKGHFAKAESLLRGTPPLDFSLFEPAVALGRTLRWQHRFREAAELFEKAAAARPESVETRLLIAESFLNLKDTAACLEVLDRAVRECPAPRALPERLVYFRLLVCALRFKEAAALGEAILDETRRTQDIEWLHWQIFTEEFDFTPRTPDYLRRAIAALDPLARARRPGPWPFFFRGLMKDLLARGKASSREDFLACARAPARRYGWMRLKAATRDLEAGRYAAAAEGLRAVAGASEPGNWKAQAGLCEALLYQRKLSEAERLIPTLAGMAPPFNAPGSDFGECLAVQGRLLLWTGRYEEALAALNTALGHTTFDGFTWRGGALVKLGRLEEALRDLDQAATFAFTPSHAEALIWRAEALWRLGRFPEALENAKTAGKSSRGNPFPALLRRLAASGRGPRGAPSEALLEKSRGVRVGGAALRIWK